MNTADNNYLKIQIHDNMVIMEWVGHVDTIDYRLGHQVFLDTVLKTNSSVWFLNYKQSGDITYEDSEWTIHDWLPKAIEAAKNVEKISVIVPENIFNKIPVRIITSKISAEYPQAEVAFFNNVEEAKQWLMPTALPNLSANGAGK
ncbi:MAG: hypothetical protein RMJ87_08520 [Cytophagales bacterium]|nr:hypothetical protein [Cytophagales bacterium]